MKYFKLFFIFILFLFNCKSESNETINSFNQVVQKKTDSIKKTLGFLKIKKSRVNYGNVKRGDTIRQEFKFFNTGKEPVTIIGYLPSCNCTDAFLESDVIEVGDSTKFIMVIDTSNKYKGLNEVTTTLKTNGQRKFYLLSTKFDIIN